jgi:hypothetical protein
MKDFNGTPGPWKIDDVEFVVCGDKCICAVGGIPFSAEDKANISLIAAAPDLLESLLSIVNMDYQPTEDESDKVYLKARAAISKALGEE